MKTRIPLNLAHPYVSYHAIPSNLAHPNVSYHCARACAKMSVRERGREEGREKVLPLEIIERDQGCGDIGSFLQAVQPHGQTCRECT